MNGLPVLLKQGSKALTGLGKKAVSSGAAGEPKGAVKIVDPSPLNWLWIMYNTGEELVRVTPRGKIRPAAMHHYRWIDNRTLEVHVRRGERFPDGELMTAATVKRSFEEGIRWANPHPPGTQFVIDRCTRCEVIDQYTVRFHLPEPDGLALGKLRAYHMMSTRFWDQVGFGYARTGTGEGHW